MPQHYLPSGMTLERVVHLRALLQQASDPDRSIDFAVFTMTAEDEVASHWKPTVGNAFTSSLDDLFAMIDRVFPGWSPSVTTNGNRYMASLTEPSPLRPHPSVSRGRPSRQLALLDAFLIEAERLIRFDIADAAAVEASLQKDSLPQIVIRARLAAGKSQKEVAMECGISPTAVSTLERGSSVYGAEIVLRTLGVDPSRVLARDDAVRPLRSRGAWGGRKSTQA